MSYCVRGGELIMNFFPLSLFLFCFVLFQIVFKAALAVSLLGSDPLWNGRVWACGRVCFLILCGGGGRWSSRLMAEVDEALGSSLWPWQAGGRLGSAASAAVTRGKNNQERTAASLSATKREIKLMSPPAKTCSLGPLAPATNCSTSVCQSNLNACDSPKRGLILTLSSAEKNIQAGVSGRGGAAVCERRQGVGSWGFCPSSG